MTGVCCFRTPSPFSVVPDTRSTAVVALAFTRDGEYLISVGRDDNHTVCVWDWANTTVPLCSLRGGQDRVLGAASLPESYFVTMGVKHVRFWSIKEAAGAKNVESKKGVFDSKMEICNVFSAAALPLSAGNGDTALTCATGASTGEIALWNVTEGRCLSGMGLFVCWTWL
jgi:WD40 repeat protein